MKKQKFLIEVTFDPEVLKENQLKPRGLVVPTCEVPPVMTAKLKKIGRGRPSKDLKS